MSDVVRHSWRDSDRFVPRSFIRPALRFMQIEAAGGGVMLVAAAVALAWANSAWSGGYEAFWTTRLEIALGQLLDLDLTLREWVNDGLMAVFFLVVGFEIKRELVTGELRDRRAAALPAIAALGGMVVPAAIYLLFNAGHAGSRGWGIPMATDIAFAAGVLSLLGSRVPTGAKLFLLTLAIIDDLGAIVVIAIFYTEDVALGWLAVAVGTVLVASWLRLLHVRSLVPFVLLGIACWVSLHESGVHATLAGVAFGLLCPAWSFHDPAAFPRHARRLVTRIESTLDDGRIVVSEHERNVDDLRELVRLAQETESPLDRIQDKLSLWVGFGVIPLFALANAGVSVGDATVDRIALGVAVGLVVGKTTGVFGATWLACRIGLGRLPTATSWAHLFGVGICAGIGFTVALFVTDLSFDQPHLADQAKVGILAGSLLAGVAGYAFLRAVASASPQDAPAGRTSP